MDHVSFSLEEGEFLGIVGESGCGKSTIAKLVMGLHRPDSGEILICDEITSALDVSVQAQIVDLILNLRESGKFSVIFISHDLALVQGLCSRIIVMNDGEIVEEGSTHQITNNPENEYTRALMGSVLSVD